MNQGQPPRELRKLTDGDYICLALTLAAALLLRSIRLMDLFPILVDESIYLRWAEIVAHQGVWFVSLLDGKPPLTYWLYVLIRLVLPEDPLFGARILSVLAGGVSTLLLFVLGRALKGRVAGHVAAMLYSIFPYAILYDRIAYTEAIVNAVGIGFAYSCVVLFSKPAVHWICIVGVGALFGIGLWCKPTFWLLACVPLVSCVLLNRARWRDLIGLYGTASVFVVALLIARPPGPMFDTGSAFVHRTDFFIPFTVLIRHPFAGAEINCRLLFSYLSSYLTVFGFILSVICGIYLFVGDRRNAVWASSIAAFPILVQVLGLRYLPSRYLFPYLWPLLLLIGIGFAQVRSIGCRRRRVWAAIPVILLGAWMLSRSVGILRDPRRNLCSSDSNQFLGSHPYAGFGSLEAAHFLKGEAMRKPFTLLTDPYWGPPADVMFAYLNKRYGICVYEAWWLQLPGRVRILPVGRTYTVKSDYQRIRDKIVDFPTLGRVLYVTHTMYFSKEDVLAREPKAELVAEFHCPDPSQAVCVYELENRANIAGHE
jgi:hypothetical protein